MLFEGKTPAQACAITAKLAIVLANGRCCSRLQKQPGSARDITSYTHHNLAFAGTSSPSDITGRCGGLHGYIAAAQQDQERYP